MKKNILVIAYFFPPLGGSGVQRTMKYVKYLSKLGYSPIVATVKNGHNFAYDFDMLKEIPEQTKVYRSNSGEKLWLRNIIEIIESSVRKVRKNKQKEEPDTAIKVAEKREVKESLKEKIFKYIEYNIYVPDSKIRWYNHAVRNIKDKILKENKIDVIYSTSYPYTDHLIGLEVKKATGLKWVADFRDPWVGNEAIMGRYGEKRINKEKELEREVVTYADKIINVTEPITEMYKERYPEFASKFVTITNGFDKDDLKEIKIEKSDKFTITYTGLLGGARTPESLIKALENICRDHEEFKKDLLVDFTGFIDEEYKIMAKSSEVKDNFKICGYVAHKEALTKMCNSNINLLILPDDEESKGVFTGKIFDYMLANRPILGIMPKEGVAANTINKSGIGLALNHQDIKEIENYILEKYADFKEQKSISTNAVEKCFIFDREYLTKELIKVIESV